MKKGTLFIFSGPSGVGKDTVRQLLDDEALNLAYSVSMTTRKPREGEEHGVDYYFVSPDEFEQAIAQGKMLEYTRFVDNYYGTPKAEVERLLDLGQNVLLEIETDGARQVLLQNPQAVSIFLLPPSMEELEKRIRNRGTESEEVIAQRLQQAAREMEEQKLYKHTLINDTPQQAAKELSELIRLQSQKG